MRYRIYERFWNKEQLADRIDLNDKHDLLFALIFFGSLYLPEAVKPARLGEIV